MVLKRVESSYFRRSLGNALEITDYETNMASFWFLDTLALQVLQNKKNLDGYYLSVLISWLAGEMTLIRDKKHPRETFLEEMKEIFNVAASKVTEENRVPYWDEIVSNDDTEKAEVEEHSVNDQRSSILNESKRESTKNLQKRQSKESRSNVKKEVNRKETFSDSLENPSSSVSEEIEKPFSNVDPILALDALMECTYDMYANEFRYTLVYAVFVEPIELEICELPFVLREPRPVKLADPMSMPFDVKLRQRFGKSKKSEKKTTGKRKKKTQPEVPVTPPPSLTDEEMLTNKRKFILPLIEAENALEIFEQYEDTR
ncbi:uncharacterized protein LOC128891295 [Hylaeus anthracinus]|uniref:uncharacterized protein LOC128891295 n=1 Tax=Hylaeus anthracinus TaxID=313031 RepID=UPI0023B94DE8|nr:uncharacterized protein LOC128891295 [Hylaeus anthracinus]